MKRHFGFVALVALVVLTLSATVTQAATVNVTKQLRRATYLAGVMRADSSQYILEGNSGSAPTCNDTTEAFYIGNHKLQGSAYASTTNIVPLFVFSFSGVPTGVAVDTVAVFIDYSHTKNGPWITKGQAVPTGWDAYCLLQSPTAASDTTGAGATKAAYAAGSIAISPLSTQPVYKGFYGLTGVTVGSNATSPVGFEYARLRLTGDKTTGTISSLFDTTVWVSFPVEVADPQTPADPN